MKSAVFVSMLAGMVASGLNATAESPKNPEKQLEEKIRPMPVDQPALHVGDEASEHALIDRHHQLKHPPAKGTLKLKSKKHSKKPDLKKENKPALKPEQVDAAPND